jgi:hypothetical protein
LPAVRPASEAVHAARPRTANAITYKRIVVFSYCQNGQIVTPEPAHWDQSKNCYCADPVGLAGKCGSDALDGGQGVLD